VAADAAVDRATWVRLASQSQNPRELAAAIAGLEQNMGWDAVEPTWKTRRSGWVSEVQGAASMAAAARLLLELEGNTRWSAVHEAWKTDRDGWVRRVSAIAPPASAAAAPRAPTARGGPAAPAAPGAAVLEAVGSPEMGYQIRVPKGAKVLGKSKLSHTYSLVLSDRINEINVSLSPIGEDSLAAALSTVQMAGVQEVLEKSELGPGQYDIVALWGPGTQQVHAYRRKGRVSIRAKCAGPATQQALLKEICGSLEIVK